eukprot:485595_1
MDISTNHVICSIMLIICCIMLLFGLLNLYDTINHRIDSIMTILKMDTKCPTHSPSPFPTYSSYASSFQLAMDDIIVSNSDYYRNYPLHNITIHNMTNILHFMKLNSNGYWIYKNINKLHIHMHHSVYSELKIINEQ